jgi:hypothetical protein|uniref:Uncharacterized protein n=1 Tax=Eutreptiella gymnastica TaxID=73025 RepID=A0A7S4FV11_9EUGL
MNPCHPFAQLPAFPLISAFDQTLWCPAAVDTKWKREKGAADHGAVKVVRVAQSWSVTRCWMPAPRQFHRRNETCTLPHPCRPDCTGVYVLLDLSGVLQSN